MRGFHRAIIFANGRQPEDFRFEIQSQDFLVAADRGLEHLIAYGLLPHLLVGDMDSLDPQLLRQCQEKVETIQLPPMKDETDLEVALNEVVKRGFDTICIVNGLGGRLDHTLGNLGLLYRPDLTNKHVWFDDGETNVHLLSGPRTFSLGCDAGDLVSIVPLSLVVQGVSTANLEYPLHNELLLAWQARGISNVTLKNRFSISLEQGDMFVIMTRKKQSRKNNTHD